MVLIPARRPGTALSAGACLLGCFLSQPPPVVAAAPAVSVWMDQWQIEPRFVPRGQRPDLPAAAVAGAAIHYIGTYAPVTQEFDDYGVGIVEVEITDTSAPLLILANSYEPVHWRVRAQVGVHMIALGVGLKLIAAVDGSFWMPACAGMTRGA